MYANEHGISKMQIIDLVKILHAENAASVDYCYARKTNYPCGLDPRATLNISAVQIIKACNCYAYQACEHSAWESSFAKQLVDAIRCVAISNLPGYEMAAWGVP